MTTNTIEQRLSGLEARVAKLEGTTSSPVARRSSTAKKVSAKEFLMTKELKSETQKALALAYYLEHVEGRPSFNINDLTAAFQSAKEKRPVNVSDTVAKNVARGLLMEAPNKKDSKKAWELTATGEKYVEEDMKK
jgi:hypothetical protein